MRRVKRIDSSGELKFSLAFNRELQVMKLQQQRPQWQQRHHSQHGYWQVVEIDEWEPAIQGELNCEGNEREQQYQIK